MLRMRSLFGRADAAAAEEPAPEPFSFPEPLPTWPQGDRQSLPIFDLASVSLPMP